MAKRRHSPKGKKRRKKVRKAFPKIVAAGFVSSYILFVTNEELQAGLVHWLRSCFNS